MSDTPSPPSVKTSLPPWFMWFFITCLAGGALVAYNYSIVRATMLREARNIPPIKEVPEFILTDQSGNIIRNKELLGEVWLANFIFTRCPGPCVALTKTIAEYQKRLEETPEVKLVSITVDPEYDTPEVLAKYAEGFQADPERWLFLTGAKDHVLSLIIKGFMLPVADNKPELVEEEGLFIHSTRVVLIDRKGMIRGYYDTESPEAVEKLFEDIPFLREQ